MEVTSNVLEDILVKKVNVMEPIVQVVQIKECNQHDLYRAALSDGTHFIPAMLGSKLKDLIENKVIQRNSLIKLLKYTVSNNSKQPLIVLNAELHKEMNSIIGKPLALQIDRNDIPKPDLSAPMTSPQRGTITASPASVTNSPSKVKMTVSPTRSNQSTMQMTTNIPIASLNQYLTSWSLIVRIISKSQMRQFQGSRPGKLFSIIMRDKNNDEIKGTFFNQEAEKFENLVEQDKVYKVSCGRVKKANERYNSTKSEFEITFDSTSSIIEIPDDNSIPANVLKFTKISDCSKMTGKTVDIISIITFIGDCQTIKTKSGSSIEKRNITVSDETGTIEVTLWGSSATEFDQKESEIFCVRNVTVSDFRGVSLNVGQSATIVVNPPDNDVKNIRNWYESLNDEKKENLKQKLLIPDYGQAATINCLSEIDEKQMCRTENGEVFCVNVMIQDMPSSRKPVYQACPNEACRGSGLIVDQETGKMICKKCNKEVMNPKLRYSLSLKVGDYSGSAYINVIGDENSFMPLINVKPEEFEIDDTTKLRTMLLKKSFFRALRVKVRGKNSEYGVKLTAISGGEVNFAEEALRIANNITASFE